MLENHDSDTIDILLVDDRTENILALEAVLSSPNYRLIKVNSGYEALRYLLNHDPALILMDVQMPEMNGFETTAIIKRNERTREIPIIFITAINSDEFYVHQGYSFGAVDYIYKPYNTQILKSKVEVFVELARKTRKLVRAEKRLLENEKKERERQVAQLELRGLRREQADQKKYRDLVEGISNGIVWSANLESLLVSFVSQSAVRILGYPLEQWHTEDGFLLRHIYQEDRPRMLEAIRVAEVENKDMELEHRFITFDFREIWLRTGIRVAQKVDGTGYELRGLSVDISKIKEVEDNLRRNKWRSDFLAEASLLLSESLDYKSTLTRLGALAVPQLADWYAIDVIEDNEQINSLSIVHSQASGVDAASEISNRYSLDPKAQFGVSKVLTTGRAEHHDHISEELLKTFAQSDYHSRILRKLNLGSAILVPLIVRGKTVGSMTLIRANNRLRYDKFDLSIAEDIARRIAMAIDNANLYEQAQSAIHARDEFLSIASHELKTPLTPLKIQIQGLMRTLRTGSLTGLSPDKVTKMLQVSDRQIGRLSKLIDDLLDISRIGVGRLSLNFEEFDLIELVREVIERFNDQFANSKCEVEFTSPESLVVHWDRFRVEQVLVNLFTNAMKYGSGQPVSISVQLEGNVVKLSVQDRGIGIAKVDQQRIFGCFERAVSGKHFGGLGLGLYIVTQILEAHGGKISVESEMGVGSIFVVELPKKVLEESIPSRSLNVLSSKTQVSAAPGAENNTLLQAPRTKNTILVVDDTQEIREVVEELLVQEGYCVATASNGEEGLQKLQNLKPDLIILDTRMPIMDGWEFLKAKKEQPEFAGIPVLVFCAGNKNKAKPPGLEAQGFLSKPIDVNDLLNAIHPFLH